jgi:hypothetical protein
MVAVEIVVGFVTEVAVIVTELPAGATGGAVYMVGTPLAV